MVGKHRGMALIISLWILAALIVVAVSFAAMVRTETQISRNYGDVIRCRWAAYTGVQRAMAQVTAISAQSGSAFVGPRSLLSSDDEQMALGDAMFETTLEDEAGKLNLNTASRDMLEALFMDAEIADSIIDWRDKDDQPNPGGAESTYYTELPMPYNCKNAPFSTVRELLLVKGVTPELLATPVKTEDGLTLEDLLTVSSSDTNSTTDGQERLNIKTASKEQMTTAFEGVDAKEIDAIIKFRDSSPLSSTAEIIKAQGVSRETIMKIYDLITVSNEKTLPGRININTATMAVLATVPDIDEELAKAIIAYREANGQFADVGQLLAVDEVNSAIFAAAADMLTVRSRHFKIVSTGRMTNGKTSRTITSLVAVTDAMKATITYWRE